jgi:hypothetical protein
MSEFLGEFLFKGVLILTSVTAGVFLGRGWEAIRRTRPLLADFSLGVFCAVLLALLVISGG